MDASEIKSVLLYDDIDNNKIFVPNEIFEDFSKIEGISATKSFCFSFYYLITYLYRTTKYGSRKYTISDLKEILGYSRTNKTMDKFIKRNGVLDKLGYIAHTTNYPISWKFDVDEQSPVFRYYNDFLKENSKEEMQHYREVLGIFASRKNMTIDVPVKGLYRSEESRKKDEKDGTFFCVKNTTRIDMDTFFFCMSNKELGTDGFWIYSFMKHMNEYYNDDWRVSRNIMSKSTGLSTVKLNKVLMALEEYNMIRNDHKNYVMGLPREVTVDGCAYHVLRSNLFCPEKKVVKRRSVVSFKTWCDRNNVDFNDFKMDENELKYYDEFCENGGTSS